MATLSKSRGRSKAKLRRRRAGSPKPLEKAVVEMAESGELVTAGEQAIRRLLRKGIPATFKRGNQIITKFGNGRERIVGHVKPSDYRPPAGVTIIEN